ncbi:MAG: alkyl hydroperoxide reductase subunit F [Eggerthia catenaformis]|uniref:alkyl hydroperoxide reductase subunit F n=1 Tax=Eggerthia catenaformis TaxID=31973 RepID=UPI003F9FA8DB
MLDTQLKQQLSSYLTLLENNIVISLSLGDDNSSKEMKKFIGEVSETSPKISIKEEKLEYTPSFAINTEYSSSGIVFAGIPLGHEFESFVLALLQVGGRAPKIDDNLKKRIQAIDKPLHFEVFASLTCHNCPDVVQALNIMSVLNPNISNTMIEGGTFKNLVSERSILAVPAIFLNKEEFFNGKISLEKIVDLVSDKKDMLSYGVFDSLIIGGGPAAMMAAIYLARKGIKTGLLSDNFGGQVKDTAEVNNILGIPSIEGPEFMKQAKAHVLNYPVEIIAGYRATNIQRTNNIIAVRLENDQILHAKTVILSLGAKWKQLGIPGEKEYLKKGIAYCVHCDGPLFKDKNVAVIGGGNSGVESAIDLARIAKKVTLIEFMPRLAADQILQNHLKQLPNVEIITNVLTKRLSGDKTLKHIEFEDRNNHKLSSRDIDGCFIQAGLVPSTEWLKDTIHLNSRGEIITDKQGATSLQGVFAAGDCTDSAFKQIIIASGSGATAALGAFNYLIRE